MPVQSPRTKKSSIVHRSESLRSEVSDASQQSKRVSFNRDVHVKRIPRGSTVVDRNGKLVAVLDGGGDLPKGKASESVSASPNGRLWVNSLAPSKEALPEEELLREAETILKHVDSVTCSTSGYDTRSLERSKSSASNHKQKGKSVQKSPSRLSDFFSRTLPSQIRNKSQPTPQLHKSTQNIPVTNGTKHYANGGADQILDDSSQTLRRSVSSDLSIGHLNGSISKSEPNLFKGVRYNKVAKIKKPHGNRVALNSIGETPTNSSSGSGSDKDSLPKKVSTSDSPVSSLSGPEEPSMASRDYNNHRVSSIVQQLSNRRGPESPERNSFSRTPVVEPLSGNTHNNNQPFSYITGNLNNNSDHSTSSGERGRSPVKTTGTSGKLLSSPKEVIYAQVVVSGKPGEPGVPGEKRTVHTTVMNGHKSPSRSSPQRTTYLSPNNTSHSPNDTATSSISPNSIQHFVYENHQGKDSDRNRGSKMSNQSSFRTGYRSAYDDFDFSGAKPRNNVTTVLLNNIDDDDTSFNSSRNNYYSSYRNRSPSPSPNFRTQTPEQSFYFGNPRNESRVINNHSNHSNHISSPSFNYKNSKPNDYYSSREVSPITKPVSSAFLVRDAERKKDSFVSSAKLVSTFGNSNSHTTDYNYVSSKQQDNNSRQSPSRNPSSKITYGDTVDSPSKSKFGSLESTRYESSNREQKSKKVKTTGSKSGTPSASNTSVNKVGLRSRENSPAPYHRDYSKSASPGKTTATLKRGENYLEQKYNRKNKDEQEKTATVKSTSTGGGGGGLISTLMRRNKDKKIVKETKEKKETERPTNNNNSTTEPAENSKESKMKRQRAKFLSAFLDKNFSSKKSSDPEKQPPLGKNSKPTDSEIEDAERRRDGEYQSWSSGDDEYRFGHHRNGQLTRGKSYNFGDLNEESATKPWYDQNDSDYRREMATTRYTSATLGRPGMRSSSYDSDMPRSKSLDRRSYRHRSPPRIVVTPNTPAVEDTDKWKSTYDPIIRTFDRDRGNANHSQLSKKMSGLSKSSFELDDHPGEHGIGSRMNSSGKLRYFGDTDVEDFNYHNSHSSGKNPSGHSKFIPRTSSYLSRGKDNYSKYYTVPGSSLNSSGSENGSRMSKGSSNAGSQRSVYLHAPAVADIPRTGMPRRTLSRDELSNYSGHQKQTRHLARSMSVLAPWRPRHYREKFEVNYNNNDIKENQPYGRPPKPPRRVIL